MKKPPIFGKESPEKKENLYILRSRKFLFSVVHPLICDDRCDALRN